MLGVEFIPAIIYFILMFFVPKSPRWLFNQNQTTQAKQVLLQIHGSQQAEIEIEAIKQNINTSKDIVKTNVKVLFSPALRYMMGICLLLGVLQQATGINAIYFYATSIFKQTGIGTDAAFSSGVLLSLTTVVFTLIAMYLVDRMGRRPLLLFGTAGIAISLLLCGYGFNQATYQLSAENITQLEFNESQQLLTLVDKVYESDINFKNDLQQVLGNRVSSKLDGSIL